jgi:hypothetical protein
VSQDTNNKHTKLGKKNKKTQIFSLPLFASTGCFSNMRSFESMESILGWSTSIATSDKRTVLNRCTAFAISTMVASSQDWPLELVIELTPRLRSTWCSRFAVTLCVVVVVFQHVGIMKVS